MKYLGLILLAFLISQAVHAQLTISGNVGYGSYGMKEMKAYQQYVLTTFPVNANVTTSFPSGAYYEILAKWQANHKFQFGAAFALGTTEGQVYYRDNLQTYGSDQRMSYQNYQLILAIQKELGSGNLILEGDLRPGLTFTQLTLKSYQTVLGTSLENETEYKSSTLAIQPTVTLSRRFTSFGIQAYAGYNLAVVPGDLASTGGLILSNSDGSVSPNWSGLRAGGGLSVYFNKAKSKESPTDSEPHKVLHSTFGLGIGLDYGGGGINALVYPSKHVGFFGGFGWALADIGYNVGAKYRFLPYDSKETSAYLLGMYGYNAAIVVSDATASSKLFYGPSFGIGVDFAGRKEGRGHWTMALLLPFREAGVNEYINKLKTSGVKFNNSLLPILLSIGHRFRSE